LSELTTTELQEKLEKPGWKFPKDFWLANFMELCERAAYYGFFILLTVYLTDLVGFDDVWGNTIAGLFAGFLYLLPPFSGAISDRIGFKRTHHRIWVTLNWILFSWHNSL
jgi:dipeptide/tripeptide permease